MAMGKKKPSKGAADGGARCRRHRRQGPTVAAAGVCPLCLRERLSRLSLSASLPSVVLAREEAAAAANSASASCSDSDASSTEASSGASSGSSSPAGFHREMRRATRPSLLMRHERVVAVNGDEVIVLARRRREKPASLWTKLVRAATGGGKKVEGCSLQASSEAADRSAATKWIVF